MIMNMSIKNVSEKIFIMQYKNIIKNRNHAIFVYKIESCTYKAPNSGFHLQLLDTEPTCYLQEKTSQTLQFITLSFQKRGFS